MRRRDCQVAISQLAIRRTMHDFLIARHDFGNRYAPTHGRRLLKHGPRGGAAAAHWLEEMAHTARSIGVLVAEAHFIGLRLFDAHATPIGLELVGDDHRQARAHTLSHLLAMAGDGHGAIGANRYEY